MYNEGENPVVFRIDNPNRYYHLDFYDFYEFEDNQFYLDRLKITTLQGDLAEGWMIVHPKTTVTREFELHTT